MRSSKSVLIIVALVIAWAILPATRAQVAYAYTLATSSTCTLNSGTSCTTSSGLANGNCTYNVGGKVYSCTTPGAKYATCSDHVNGCYTRSNCVTAGCPKIAYTASPIPISCAGGDCSSVIANLLADDFTAFDGTALNNFCTDTYIDSLVTVNAWVFSGGSSCAQSTSGGTLAVVDTLTFDAGTMLTFQRENTYLENYGLVQGAGKVIGGMGNSGTLALQSSSSSAGFFIGGDLYNYMYLSTDLLVSPVAGALLVVLGGKNSCEDGKDSTDVNCNYSHLHVQGEAYLSISSDRFGTVAGALEVALSPNFFPSAGDEFTIINADNGINGQFDPKIYSPQCFWTLSYDLNVPPKYVSLTNGECADAGGNRSLLASQIVPGTTINGLVHGGYNTLQYNWLDISDPYNYKTLMQLSRVEAPTTESDFGGCPLDLSRLSSSLSLGVYNLRLQVTNDNGGNFVTADMFLTIDDIPTANAGMDQPVHKGDSVKLDGSLSTDPAGLPLTYAWSFVSTPSGSNAMLNFDSMAPLHPTFTADMTGNYVVQLVVTNSAGRPSAPSQVTISTTNTPPVADAGPDQTGVNGVVQVGSTVKLDGSDSYDLDGDPITYVWAFVSKPQGSSATLANATTKFPSFVADVDGTYVIQLVVSDPWVASGPKTVNVSFINVQPVADAGASQTGVVGDPVNLNGSGSYDANLLPLTYQWSFVSRPPWSKAVITNPTAVNPVFVPDQPGIYIVQLVVQDAFLTSVPKTAQIKVISEMAYVHQLLKALVDSIGSLDCKVFKNRSMRNDLIRRLHDVTTDVEMRCHGDALQDLNDILRRVDGCTASGVPDRDDWIVDCLSQKWVYVQLIAIIAEVKELDGGGMRR